MAAVIFSHVKMTCYLQVLFLQGCFYAAASTYCLEIPYFLLLVNILMDQLVILNNGMTAWWNGRSLPKILNTERQKITPHSKRWNVAENYPKS